MSRAHSLSRIPFDLPGGCQCLGSPHEKDTVWFRPKLSLEGGAMADTAIRAAVGRGLSTFTDDVQKELGWILTFQGIESWNFLDDDGKPIPVTQEVIRYGLDWVQTGSHLWEKATELYGEEAFVPFQARLQSFSARRQTAGSTSRSRSTSRKRSTPSRPSSRTTSAASMPSPG